MQTSVLFHNGQYTFDVLHAAETAVEQVTTSATTATSYNNNLLKNGTMLLGATLGATLAPSLATAQYIKNTEKKAKIERIISLTDDALGSNRYDHLPTFYIEEGILCCDTRDGYAEGLHAVNATMETNAIASAVFTGTKPMTGPAYDHLTRLVRKNAKKQSSIPGML